MTNQAEAVTIELKNGRTQIKFDKKLVYIGEGETHSIAREYLFDNNFNGSNSLPTPFDLQHQTLLDYWLKITFTVLEDDETVFCLVRKTMSFTSVSVCLV